MFGRKAMHRCMAFLPNMKIFMGDYAISVDSIIFKLPSRNFKAHPCERATFTATANTSTPYERERSIGITFPSKYRYAVPAGLCENRNISLKVRHDLLKFVSPFDRKRFVQNVSESEV